MEEKARGERFLVLFLNHRGFCPYFHGNRSPWADPTLRGMVCGLTLSATLDDRAIL